MGSTHSLIAEFKSSMKSMFEMSDLGLLHYFLGLEVKQGEDGVFISQRKYATDLLKRLNMVNCKVVATPMNVNEKLQLEDGTEKANARSFRSLVGGLIYLAHTRPDISFSMGVISRFMCNPSKHHFGAAKRILRYVAGTLDYGIWYTYVSDFRLFGFTDSDWAGSLDDRRSTSGNIFSLGSCAITWCSKKKLQQHYHLQRQSVLQLLLQLVNVYGLEDFLQIFIKGKKVQLKFSVTTMPQLQ